MLSTLDSESPGWDGLCASRHGSAFDYILMQCMTLGGKKQEIEGDGKKCQSVVVVRDLKYLQGQNGVLADLDFLKVIDHLSVGHDDRNNDRQEQTDTSKQHEGNLPVFEGVNIRVGD